MAFTKQDFALMYSMPLSAADWANLRTSKVKRVVMPLGIASRHISMCEELGDMGVSLTLRCEDAYPTVHQVAQGVQAVKAVCKVDALILPGNEPEFNIDMHWGKPWQENDARQHATAVTGYRQWLGNALPGLPLIAPALSAQIKTEGDVIPGYYTWREIIAPAYNACEGGIAVHIYGLNWASEVDKLRMKHLLSMHCAIWHRSVHIAEIGIFGEDRYPLTDVQRVQAYVEIAGWILAYSAWSSRIETFCPFVSNGNGVSWSPKYLISNPQAYKIIGDWMGA